MTLRITLDIFRTFAPFFDAVPLTIASYKPLLPDIIIEADRRVVNLRAHHVHR